MTRRPRPPCGGPLLTASVVAAALAGIAAADEGAQPLRLEYHSAPGCPDEEAFLARVQARAPLARQATTDEKAPTFRVVLTAGERPSGTMTVLDGLGQEGERSLDANSCAEVTDALALMVALALPRALSAVSPEPEAAVDAGGADAATSPVPTIDAGTADASGPPAPPPAALSPSTGPEVPQASGHRFFGGVDLAVSAFVTPTTLFAGAPYLGWRGHGGALLAPSVRLSFLRAGTGPLDITGGKATFLLTVGRIDGCAILWPNRPLELSACARVEGGGLDVSGASGSGDLTQRRAWFAAGLLARLEWSFFGPLLLDVSAGPSFHITPEQFGFEVLPSGVFPGAAYQVPYVGFSAEVGLGVHFL